MNLKLMFTTSFRTAALAGLLCFGLVGCGDDGESDDKSGPTAIPEALTHEAAEAYQAIVLASYEDSYEAALALDAALNALVDGPSEQTLEAARDAWLAAREPYLQTEAFRFYDGPIDNADVGVEGLVNAWPLDEGYIDYVEDDENAGIINDASVEISADTLSELNEEGSEKNIATGFHAIEFLLWGQDLNRVGPGARPYTDYVTGGQGTHENQDRRGRYLLSVSALLADNLKTLVDAWAEDEDNYRAEFEELSKEEALRSILTGMITLSGFETGGERLQTALDTRDQEDEHSCFSDNTHRDMIQDIQGVLNVYTGSYRRTDGSTVSGESIRAIVEVHDPALAEEIEERIETSLSLAKALETPFDREIDDTHEGGRERVQDLVDSLRIQEGLLEEVFQGFGLAIPVPPA
jgi:putative iron-regulated protein